MSHGAALRVITALFVSWLTTAVHAETVLSAGAARITAGAPFELTLTITNDDAAPVHVDIPQVMRARIETPAEIGIVEFAPDRSGDLTIGARQFEKIRLRGSSQKNLQGVVTLTLTELAANPIALQIDAPAADQQSAAIPDEAKDEPGPLVGKPPPLAVSVYEPLYFIVGGDGGLNAKFQISFRYRFFDERGRLAQRIHWIDDLYLSYSQTSLWDLHQLSKPFTDSSYRPRFFYANYDLTRLLNGRIRIGIESGFGHESNGKDGEESRSFNMLYARPTVTVGDPDGLRFYAAPLIHNYRADGDNPDLKDYRGYVDWVLGFGSKGGLDFWTTLRKGTRGNYGSAELNASYPLAKLSGGGLTGWLMLQYFGGYGESLLNYQYKLDSQLRLGIAIAL